MFLLKFRPSIFCSSSASSDIRGVNRWRWWILNQFQRTCDRIECHVVLVSIVEYISIHVCGELRLFQARVSIKCFNQPVQFSRVTQRQSIIVSLEQRLITYLGSTNSNRLFLALHGTRSVTAREVGMRKSNRETSCCTIICGMTLGTIILNGNDDDTQLSVNKNLSVLSVKYLWRSNVQGRYVWGLRWSEHASNINEEL